MTNRLKFCLIAAGVALSAQAMAEDKSAATGAGAGDGEEPYLATETLESCMKRWDARTHMSKAAWRDTCKRISQERGSFLRKERAGDDN
jgi:hypothetical protein